MGKMTYSTAFSKKRK